jgi:hypothetical protein
LRVLQESLAAQDAARQQAAALEAKIKGGEEHNLLLTQQQEKVQAQLESSERQVIHLLVRGGLLKASVEDSSRQLASSEGQVIHLVVGGALLKAELEPSEHQGACLKAQLELLQEESVIRENERQVCLLATARQLHSTATCRTGPAVL